METDDMTTTITVNPVHAVHIEVRGEQETISDILEAGSAPREYVIWGDKVLSVSELPNAPSLTTGAD
jgi:hypothetical protein